MNESGALTMYSDGIEIGTYISGDHNTAFPTVDRVNSYIGRSNWVSDSYFSGTIDDF